MLSAAFLNSTLLLAVLYNDGLYLESLSIEPGYTDKEGAPFEFAMDRKVDEGMLKGIDYDEQTRQSTITFPYPLSAEPLVVSRYSLSSGDSTVPPGVVFRTVSWSGTKAVVSGDCRNVPLYAGIPFLSLFTFSKQVMREDAGGQGGRLAISEGRLA